MNHVAITYFISVRMPCQQRSDINDDNIYSLEIEPDKMMPFLTEEKDSIVSVSPSQNQNTKHFKNLKTVV